MTRFYFKVGIICLLLALPLALAFSEEAEGVPEKPANLRVTATNAEENSFSLAWDEVSGAKGYYIYQVPQGRRLGWIKWLTTTPDPITTPSAEVRKVTLNTNYSYRVTAFNDSGESLPSDTVDLNLTK